MMELTTEARDVKSLGPLSLDASRQLLVKDGTPVGLGARTLDVLVELVSRPNEVVSKIDLLTRVWPDATVEEGSLRFHIGNLRQAPCVREDGARYIATLKGRGYYFVAPISRSSGRAEDIAAAARSPRANLPARLTGMFGRQRGRRV
jgi:DNA-binding winged helix-turn-helix (wHTH) protein